MLPVVLGVSEESHAPRRMCVFEKIIPPAGAAGERWDIYNAAAAASLGGVVCDCSFQMMRHLEREKAGDPIKAVCSPPTQSVVFFFTPRSPMWLLREIRQDFDHLNALNWI